MWLVSPAVTGELSLSPLPWFPRERESIQQSVLESDPINGGTNCSIEPLSSFHKPCIVGDALVSQSQLHSQRTHSLAWGHKANRRETISGQWSLEKYAEVTAPAAAGRKRWDAIQRKLSWQSRWGKTQVWKMGKGFRSGEHYQQGHWVSYRSKQVSELTGVLCFDLELRVGVRCDSLTHSHMLSIELTKEFLLCID